MKETTTIITLDLLFLSKHPPAFLLLCRGLEGKDLILSLGEQAGQRDSKAYPPQVAHNQIACCWADLVELMSCDDMQADQNCVVEHVQALANDLYLWIESLVANSQSVMCPCHQKKGQFLLWLH